MADPEIRSTPEKYPTVGALSRLVGRVDKFARAPFGYSNPPVEMLSDLLEIPALYRTGENIAYGSPLTIGAGQARRMTEDTTGAVGGALNLLGPAASTAKLAVKGAKAAAPRAGALAQQFAARTQPMPLQMNIVKPKGGNWLAGSLEPVTKPMKSYVPSEESLLRAEAVTPVGAAEARARSIPDAALNKWIDKKLNPYIKNEMGTPEDPVRALAEEGILHYQPRQMAEGSTFMRIVNENRARGGFPSEDAAVTPLAKLWERYADYAVSPMQAGSRLSKNKQDLSNYRNAQPIEKENPWLLKVPPETQVYDLTNYGDAYGFPHLVDELKAAVNPASEVPEHLRLTVEQLDKVTVPQAVKRVAEINAWRAKQAAEAEKQGLMANLQATPRLKDESMQLSFVEKPGATWVDVPETVTEDGVKLCTSLGKAGGWCTQSEMNAKSYGSGSNRLTTLIDAEGRPHAQAKITTQVDDASKTELAGLLGDEEAIGDQFYRNIATVLERRGFDDAQDIAESVAMGDERGLPQNVRDILADVEAEAEAMLPKKNLTLPDIEELKPPGNSFTSERSTEYLKRDPDYKAKVTDSVLKFLNSGEWGKVKDLQHYDIADLKDSNSITNAINNLYPGDFQKGADAFNMAADMEPNTPRFMSQSQLREFIEPSTKPEGFAKGGLVEYDPDHIESLAQAFHEEELPGVGSDIDYKDLENLTRNVQGMRQNNIDILGAGMRFNPSEDIGVNLMGNIVQNAGPKDIRSLILGLELADKYGVNLNKEGLQDIYANYVDDGSYYQGSYNPKYKAVNLGRMNQKDNSSLNLTISPDYKGVTYQRKFASGGAVNYNQSHIDELAAQFHKEM